MNPSLASPRADVARLAEQTGFPVDAIESMARSIARGGGRMAQFDHPAFGGPGQWMRGGMLMIADPFDHALKQRIAQLCERLVDVPAVLRADAAPMPARQTQRQGAGEQQGAGASSIGSEPDGPSWYPAGLGRPSSSGAQNRTRYAWFADAGRLAVDDGARVTIYDTGDHAIHGVSQQQGRDGTMAFTSQHGTVDLARLPVVDGSARAATTPPAPPDADSSAGTTIDPFDALERLAALHARGIVSDDEFAAKRVELLARI